MPDPTIPLNYYTTRPSDAMLNIFGVVTHSNYCPIAQNVGGVSSSPCGFPPMMVQMLQTLGIRNIRDDCIIDQAFMKGASASAANYTSSLAQMQTFYQALEGTNIKVQAIVQTPQALQNLIALLAAVPGAANIIAAVEGPNESNDSSLSAPAAYLPYPDPLNAGWGTTAASAWSSGSVSYTTGTVVTQGALGNTVFVCTANHVSSAGNGPGNLLTNGGGLYLTATQSTIPWVPHQFWVKCQMVKLLLNAQALGQIPANWLVSSSGEIAGGTPDNWQALRSFIYCNNKMFGTYNTGTSFGHIHLYGSSGNSTVSSIWNSYGTILLDNLTPVANAFNNPGGVMQGENGNQSSSTATEIQNFCWAMLGMVEAYRVGMPRFYTYQLTDYSNNNESSLGGGAWPSPIGSYSSGVGGWDTYGLWKINNVVLNGLLSHDMTLKSGGTMFSNYTTAIGDTVGTQPRTGRIWPLVMGGSGVGNINPILVLQRVSGQIDVHVSNNNNSAQSLTIGPLPGTTWTSVATIDPAVGSTPASVSTAVTNGSPYSFSAPVNNGNAYPIIIRITP